MPILFNLWQQAHYLQVERFVQGSKGQHLLGAFGCLYLLPSCLILRENSLGFFNCLFSSSHSAGRRPMSIFDGRISVAAIVFNSIKVSWMVLFATSTYLPDLFRFKISLVRPLIGWFQGNCVSKALLYQK